jgi:hypothetical protein
MMSVDSRASTTAYSWRIFFASSKKRTPFILHASSLRSVLSSFRDCWMSSSKRYERHGSMKPGCGPTASGLNARGGSVMTSRLAMKMSLGIVRIDEVERLILAGRGIKLEVDRE